MSVTAGEMRHRVAFERRGTGDDGYGNVETDWEQPFGNVAAAIQPKFGGEQVTAARLEGRQPVNITVRSSQATRLVTTDWRVRDVRTERVYAISSIADPDDRKQWIEMLCQYASTEGSE